MHALACRASPLGRRGLSVQRGVLVVVRSCGHVVVVLVEVEVVRVRVLVEGWVGVAGVRV